jgi:hypothetical protein
MTEQHAISAINVAITVSVNGIDKRFDADATTGDDPYTLAGGVLVGVTTEAQRWISEAGSERRRTQR